MHSFSSKIEHFSQGGFSGDLGTSGLTLSETSKACDKLSLEHID